MVALIAPEEQAFRSTPPRRGRQPCPCTSARIVSCFDPRPREGGDSRRCKGMFPHMEFRSTPPRRGRRLPRRFLRGIERVSIHAPAKGAT